MVYKSWFTFKSVTNNLDSQEVELLLNIDIVSPIFKYIVVDIYVMRINCAYEAKKKNYDCIIWRMKYMKHPSSTVHYRVQQ
jgi:hypothetical protein